MWEVSSNNGRQMKLAGSKLCAEVARDRSRFVPVLQKCHGSGGSQAWVWIENVIDYYFLSVCLCLSVCLSLSLSVCLSLPPSLSLFPCLSVGLPPPSFPLSVNLSLSTGVCETVCDCSVSRILRNDAGGERVFWGEGGEGA